MTKPIRPNCHMGFPSYTAGMAEGAWVRPLQLSAAHQPFRARLDGVRFLVFGRSLPAVLFALLGYRVLLNLVAQFHTVFTHATPLDVVALLPSALYLVFCGIPVGVYLTRSRAKASDGRIVARAAALVGTTMLLVVGILGGPVLYTAPLTVQLAATLLTIIAFSVAVHGLLSLRRNLSLMPEARRLVTDGPYRVIRHPLYAAEILAAMAMTMSRPALWAVVGLAPFIAVQLLRARFEEGLLRRVFPEYSAYARRTKRVVPRLW